jgi:hypothetical protein
MKEINTAGFEDLLKGMTDFNFWLLGLIFSGKLKP